MKITVVGAGFYGSTLVQRIAEADIVDEVVMTDIIEDKPQGLALDMMQARSIEGFEKQGSRSGLVVACSSRSTATLSPGFTGAGGRSNPRSSSPLPRFACVG